MLRILFFIGFVVVTIKASDYRYYLEVGQTYKFHKTPQKWFDAIKTCRRENAKLAMPKNEAEVSVLKEIFNGFPASILKDIAEPNLILIGFHDIFTEGDYVTYNGKSIQNYFHTWAVNEPNNRNDNEDCGSLHRSGKLNDYLCNIPAAFICQKNKREVKNSASSLCISPDPEYKYSNQTYKCYKFHEKPKTWPEAYKICVAEGGNLAIINSITEKKFLVTMFEKVRHKISHVIYDNDVLLGFHDIFDESNFVTVEGEELQSTEYTKWSSGEPNNDKDNEDCGSMHITGELNDFPCNISTVFICEIESIVYPLLQNFLT